MSITAIALMLTGVLVVLGVLIAIHQAVEETNND